MKTCVFYSYKGGTGRTLALANVAAFGAAVGKRVVVIDMDLEAPGVTYKLVPSESAGSRARCRGLVGCLLDAIADSTIPAELDSYFVEALPANDLLGSRQDGRLLVMPAGSVPSANYFSELRRLSFDARAADGSALQLMTALIERIRDDHEPDLLLIDARTGITNSNTLALAELADEVYAFCLDLPEQLDGVRMVLRSLSPLVETESRPVKLFAVLSRVPTDVEHQGAGWLRTEADAARCNRIASFLTEPAAQAKYSLNSIDILQLHHYDSLVGSEELLLQALGRPGVAELPLAWDYSRLAARVIDDGAAIGAAASAISSADRKAHAHIAALVLDEPDARAVRDERHPIDEDYSSSTARSRVDELRNRAARDPASRPQFANSLFELAAALREVGDESGALNASVEAVDVFRTLASEDRSFDTDLARGLSNLALRLRFAGDFRGALAAATEAVDLLRRTAGDVPPADLARALNNLATAHSETGDHERALAAIEEAVDIRRNLVATSQEDQYVGDLAGSLNNLSIALEALGRLPGAVKAAEEAVGLYRRLPDSDRSPTELADSLINLSAVLGSTGDVEGSLSAVQEAVDIYRPLAESTPNGRRNLATALSNLSAAYGRVRDWHAAVASAQAAVDVRAELAAEQPSLFGVDLAISLTNLAGALSEVGERDRALAAITESVERFRGLAAAESDAYRPMLASALINESRARRDVGDTHGAIQASREAIAELDVLVDRAPAGAFDADLANALNNLCVALSDAGDRVGALEAGTRSVAVLRELRAHDRPQIEVRLADSLNNLARVRAAHRDVVGAQRDLQEAVAIYRQLNDFDPNRLDAKLAGALSNLGNIYSDVGDDTAAYEATRESAGIFRRLANEDPVAYSGELAAVLSNLAGAQLRTSRILDARSSIDEAVAIYRDLAENHFGVFAPPLARALANKAQAMAAADPKGALDAVTESVRIFDKLYDEHPAFASGLAGALRLNAFILEHLGRENDASLLRERAELVSGGEKH